MIEAQVREIAKMKQLIGDLEGNPVPPGATDLLSGGMGENAPGR